MTAKYNDPYNGQPSSIGPQLVEFAFQRKAITEAAQVATFTPLAKAINMPKHHGKTMKVDHYLPIIDDANMNDQGIDAQGITTKRRFTIVIANPSIADDVVLDMALDPVGGQKDLQNFETLDYAVGEGANAGAAQAAAEADALSILTKKYSVPFTTDYAGTKAAAESAGFTVTDSLSDVPVGGNLYGSSKDVGTLLTRLPVLGEEGGRVNRVGMTRVQIEGSIHNFGMFQEYTKDSIDFDSDDQLLMHYVDENVKAASKVYEDTLGLELMHSAGVVRYPGAATSMAGVSGATGAVTKLTYDGLRKMNITLNSNKCPKSTKLIAGSTNVDTRTIRSARYAFIGPEIQTQIEDMEDSKGDRVFVPVHQYADAANIREGEIGSIGETRFIVVEDLLHWAGAGAAEGTNDGYRTTGGNYDVFPILIVGAEAFSTIGYHMTMDKGKRNSKFQMIHKKPGVETADRNDPYGKKGFISTQWWYGTLVTHPQHIAVAYTVAEW